MSHALRRALGLSPHRIRMLGLFGLVAALFAAYAGWTGLAYLGRVGGGLRMTAFLPTSGDSLGPASNVKYHGLVVGRVITIKGPDSGSTRSRAEIVVKPDQADTIPANVTARCCPRPSSARSSSTSWSRPVRTRDDCPA